jgi:hypothetical protein
METIISSTYGLETIISSIYGLETIISRCFIYSYFHEIHTYILTKNKLTLCLPKNIIMEKLVSKTINRPEIKVPVSSLLSCLIYDSKANGKILH